MINEFFCMNWFSQKVHMIRFQHNKTSSSDKLFSPFA